MQNIPGTLATLGLALSAAIALGVLLYTVRHGGVRFWRFLALLLVALALLSAALDRIVREPPPAPGISAPLPPPNRARHR